MDIFVPEKFHRGESGRIYLFNRSMDNAFFQTV
jgi:hypothetical protein